MFGLTRVTEGGGGVLSWLRDSTGGVGGEGFFLVRLPYTVCQELHSHSLDTLFSESHTWP